MGNAVVLYDILQDPSWPISASSIVVFSAFSLLLTGIVLVSGWGVKRKKAGAIGCLLLALVLLAVLILSLALLVSRAKHEHDQCRDWARTGAFELVEGFIKNYKPMPPGGHAHEEFTVEGARFEYSAYDLRYSGFRQTRPEGGPLREGMYVRIAHREGRILRIELFTGK